MQKDNIIRKIYAILFKAYGPQHWWPAQTPFEVVVGAILTQNTNWKNVERAISNLRECGCLSPERILRCRDLPELIRPSGYYNVKAERLRDLCRVILGHGGLRRLLHLRKEKARQVLLSVKGVGEETADSILLYAGKKPVFVVDAYTRRIFSRMGVISSDLSYTEIQKIFVDNLPRNVKVYNEYHALIVRLGKHICTKKNPRCDECPVKGLCSYFRGK